MSEHTPGRLVAEKLDPDADYDYDFVIRQIDGDPYPITVAEDISEANARRLAACWNACDGVPTELLEAYPAPFTELRTQRDELLEALDELSQIASVLQAVCLGDERAKENRLDRALAAIAKVKGGSA